ncbi:phosphate signaling complex protein PhoU [Brachyspira hyodysenteriae]|uniref:Phosphate-specific transport system accessory protein PhoU n=1 Tax=Brachyspira hyodysenteriae (strain ATCC 49526 / WA1) TaxID=565034 RepID=A0A3B6V8J4_BRAHW|nr:phosphate signaling complex protein PhoU [Brachyspira hyodysenteriae]ACN82895.1 phosphate uptake regulator, PhoU [Brachyspira hyodysenteriae WA1]AUJ48642.1 phosphate transport system regulatory protein PhoU [Brachyspira hyodysenteriae]KLI15103.1 PhoU family transcriptional regulator [Brachyspira hyodysenteriae]KLI29916.1 PhoU family transcriptional regulator [Brachyspira hyodysenteriae]KLI35338.1 PhoU family transcriptional regulator [Brachyspira hyodysenteriae]
MKKFDEELNKLIEHVTEASDMILEALRNSTKALTNGDIELANQVIENDRNINRISYKIESSSLKMLLLEHPVATDLRIVSSALKIATDLERIGDQAKDICDLLRFLLEGNIYKKNLNIIIEMSNIIEYMITNCLNAFKEKNAELSRNVIAKDDEVDKLFYKMRDSMVDLIKSGAENADQAIYLMMIAKYFEKMGDHAENIAKWVYYYSTGERFK